MALVLGVGLVFAAAYLGLYLVPFSNGVEPGASTSVTERAETWTPEDGWREDLREATARIEVEDDGLVFEERLSSPAPPRGNVFELPVEEDLRLAHEPGARASFPPMPVFQEPRDTVYVAVPWSDGDQARVGAYDRFEHIETVERDGVTLLEYHARHGSQQFLHDGTIWTRASERTALVEPVTGTVVDYEDHETLWAEPHEDDDPVLGSIKQQLAEREKVWEATIEPTDASSSALLDQAEAARDDHVQRIVAAAAAPLIAGQALLAAGLTGRPRRLMAPEAA